MQEITRRLHENRQIQLAKEILESNGYKVEKKNLDEAGNMDNYVDQRPQAAADKGEKNYFVTELSMSGAKLLTPELVTLEQASAVRKKARGTATVHDITKSADAHLAKKFGFIK